MTHDFWKVRNVDEAQIYWDTRAAGYRGLLADSLKVLAPFTSLLELGSSSGPNLWAIRQRWPDVELVGIDPSDVMASFGWFRGEESDRAGESLGIEFCVGDNESITADGVFARPVVSEMGETQGDVAPAVAKDPIDLGPFDVILTCYTMAYLSPFEASQTLKAMGAVAKRGIVLAEPGPKLPGILQSRLAESVKVPHWEHPLELMAQEALPGWKITSRPFAGPQGLETLTIAVR